MTYVLVALAAAVLIAGGVLFVQQVMLQAIEASSIVLDAHALANVAASLKRAPSGWRSMWE